MNAANAITNKALCAVMAALHHLDAIGATVISVRLDGTRPLLRIDVGGGWVQGALKKRIREHGALRTVLVASVHGCLVEWEERYPAQAAA